MHCAIEIYGSYNFIALFSSLLPRSAAPHRLGQALLRLHIYHVYLVLATPRMIMHTRMAKHSRYLIPDHYSFRCVSPHSVAVIRPTRRTPVNFQLSALLNCCDYLLHTTAQRARRQTETKAMSRGAVYLITLQFALTRREEQRRADPIADPSTSALRGDGHSCSLRPDCRKNRFW